MHEHAQGGSRTMNANSPTETVVLQPKSLTHQHLLTAVKTEIQGGRRQGPLRVLDAGCGDGHLMAFLQAHLTRLLPNRVIDVHGFEVHDSQSHRPNFIETTGNRLCALLPGVPWPERIELISVQDAWPYKDESFDFVVSNQVLEHVIDLRRFLTELARVVAPGGVSIHIFPLRNARCDGHVRMPLVHRIHGFEQREALTRLLAAVFGSRIPPPAQKRALGPGRFRGPP
ncbi:class I SAM-dependent methyltransferase [Nonomuraea polychroma]|uniref:class I SAM-dependent methyltransferase n=1 Tax=Nonomuraea polychroma TaxID=46176 RepID=UPI003D916D9F